MKLTLGQAKQQLYSAVVPNLNSQENIERLESYINLAQERLINSGKWNGTIFPVRFSSPSGIISLPRKFGAVLAIKWVKGDNSGPIRIRNGWFSYMNPIADLWTATFWPRYGYTESNIDDLGDGYATYQDATYTSYKLKVEIEDASDAGKEVVIKGKDTNGDDVTIQVSLVDSTVTNAQVFSGALSLFQKPITNGKVNLYAVDEATSAETQIGEYEESETTAAYRRYAVPNDETVDYLDALCKLRYIPCVLDTDEVVVSNLGALKTMLMSLRYEDEADLERSEMFFMKALQLLNGENKEVRGGTRWTLNIDSGAMQFNNLWPGR